MYGFMKNFHENTSIEVDFYFNWETMKVNVAVISMKLNLDRRNNNGNNFEREIERERRSNSRRNQLVFQSVLRLEWENTRDGRSYAQVKRFRMETKAAKTLGIIVGGFIMCWLPFFTMYVVRAFCPNCIHPTVFSVLFWLGYCNSAINPCIYALFSKDFRFAFKRIICKCFCKRRANTLRRGSDGSQLAMRSVFSSLLIITGLGNNWLID